MKRISLLLTIAFFAFTACKQSVEEKEDSAPKNSLKETEAATLSPIEVYPVDSLLLTEILPLGSFHNDEVDSSASDRKWLGLFKGKDGFYLSSTKINLKNVYDAVLDEDENQKTGWEVSTEHIDSCYILIEPLTYIKEMKIEQAHLKKQEIYPNEKLTFKYLNIEYNLYATGQTEKIEGNSVVIENYKLYLTATINGKKTTELLVSTRAFDDYMIKILFAGDIDGDQKLDFLIDTSSDYNATRPTLYLSKPAGNGHLVKPIASHTSVGC